MNIPQSLYYTKTHEWVELKGEEAVIGITDFAQHQLGDIVFVELPEVGREVKKEEAVAVIESVKAASDIYSPLSGTIINVNQNISEEPELVNSSPYKEGWIFSLKLNNPEEIAELLKAEDYKKLIAEKE